MSRPLRRSLGRRVRSRASVWVSDRSRHGTPAGPAIIQKGPGDLVLFGMIFTNKVGTLNTSTKEIREYSVPGHTTQGVTLGPDGAIWYTSPMSQQIGRIDPDTGDVQAVDLIALRDDNKLPITPGGPLPTQTTIRTGGDGALYFGQGRPDQAGPPSGARVLPSARLPGGCPRLAAVTARGTGAVQPLCVRSQSEGAGAAPIPAAGRRVHARRGRWQDGPEA